jgi:Zn-dependent oligopeptidase
MFGGTYMNKMTQRAAVYAALLSVFGVTEFEGPVTPTKEQRAQVNQILFAGFRKGTIELSADKNYSDSELKAYVSGLQSNWLRKDKRLNGGVTYVAKNPGSRAGVGDETVKNMKMLRDTQTDPVKRAEIQKFIDARVAEIKPSKSKELTEEQKQKLIDLGLGDYITS